MLGFIISCSGHRMHLTTITLRLGIGITTLTLVVRMVLLALTCGKLCLMTPSWWLRLWWRVRRIGTPLHWRMGINGPRLNVTSLFLGLILRRRVMPCCWTTLTFTNRRVPIGIGSWRRATCMFTIRTLSWENIGLGLGLLTVMGHGMIEVMKQKLPLNACLPSLR